MPPAVKLLLLSVLFGCVVGALLFGVIYLIQDISTVPGAGVRSAGPLFIPALLGVASGWFGASKAEETTGTFSMGLVAVGSVLAAGAAFGVAFLLCGQFPTHMTQDRIILILALTSGGLMAAALLTAWIEEQ